MSSVLNRRNIRIINSDLSGYQDIRTPVGNIRLHDTDDKTRFIGYGTTGTIGTQGLQGTQGIIGFQGLRGNQGSIGLQGHQGLKGDAGKGFIVFANINTFEQINSLSTSNSNIGEFVLVKGGELYVYMGKNNGSTGPQNDFSYVGDVTDESKLVGLQGNVGTQGSTGPNGVQGVQGSTGNNGLQGRIGVQGAQGNIGAQGSSGSNGLQGAQGNIGAQGSAGTNGLQGVQGSVGAQGSAGTNGLQGVQGNSGSNGLQGAQGNVGAQGSAGSNGLQGVQGSIGTQGNAGSNGFQGTQGVQGNVGAQGNAGSNGLQGVQGNVGTQGSAGSNGFQGVQGSIGPQGGAGSNGLQGVQGSIGTQGNAGSNGFQGAQGVIGSNGLQGVQGSIGPQGGTGSNGFQGAQGSIGTQGNAGSNGLQGVQGSIGTQGNAGSNGFQGAQGSIGTQGNAGSNGFQGTQGVQGNVGVQGNIGTQGLQGPTGASSIIVNKYSITGVFNNIIDTTKDINIINFDNLYGSWVSVIKGLSADYSYGIAVDSSGNSYVTGYYTPPSTIYNSDGTSFQTITGSGSSDVFIVKYGSTGMGVWSSKISGISVDNGNQISVDSSGNSYITGFYVSLATIYNSDGTAFQTITGSGAEDVFLVKYDSTGMGIWSSKIIGINIDNSYGISVDSSGNSYITGVYTPPSTIYNSNGTVFQTITGSGSNDAFIIKYGSTGMGVWSSKISGIYGEYSGGISVDSSGNSYITGSYTSPATIYNSDGTAFQTITGSGSNDAFIVKYGSTGMGIWSSKISGINVDIGYSIDVDILGNSYVTGYYTSPSTIYNSDGTAFQTITGSGSSDVFVVKYGSTGMGIWSSKISGINADTGYSIKVDSSGNSYITGQYRGFSTIYNSDGTVFKNIIGIGSDDAFVLKYSSIGMGLSCAKIGGTSIDTGYSIDVDTLGNVYITGNYSSSATIYNSDDSVFKSISSSGSFDAFVVKYKSENIFYLIDLDNIISNNGKTVYVINSAYKNGFILNIQTQSLITYLSINVNTSISLVFYNGKWYVLSQT